MDMSGVQDASVDLVFSGQNLEHLWPEEVSGSFLETWRILREGGYFVIDSPNRNITAPLNWSHPEHTVELTSNECFDLLALAGFDVVTCHGIWLCRDPLTKRMLPFEPQTNGEWSIPERLISASDNPNDSFIWWIVAQKSGRTPDRDPLSRAMGGIFSRAWPERWQRVRNLIGRPISTEDGDWFEAGFEESGCLLYGPYAPLHAGDYSVEFELVCSSSSTTSQPAARIDVVGEEQILAFRELMPSDLRGQTAFSIDFSLSKTTFGMQFRCFSYGASLRCRRSVKRNAVRV
jgi:hypothetical protein